MNDLDDKRSIWIQEPMLGTVRTIRHRGRQVSYRLPPQINGQVTLRFKGYGRVKKNQTGDLFLLVRLDAGCDIKRDLWLPESEAAAGCQKILKVEGRPVTIPIPHHSRNNEVGRVAGAGAKTPYEWGLPFLNRPRGCLCVTLHTFPDKIQPVVGAAENLSADDLALEGWIYRRIDFVMGKMGDKAFRAPALNVSTVAQVYNDGGWRALAGMLVARLPLRGAQIQFFAVKNLPVPGQCRRQVARSVTRTSVRYEISIQQGLIDKPFAVMAVLSHELCHAVHSRRLAQFEDYVSKSGAELLEEERTVDLLLFMFQLGEFQMRVARDSRMTMGYFNQALFERMQVILDRKRRVWSQEATFKCHYCGRVNPPTASHCSGCGLPPE